MHRMIVNLATGTNVSLKSSPLDLPVPHEAQARLVPRRAVPILVNFVLDLVNPLALQNASTGRAIRQAPSLVLADGLHLVDHGNLPLSRFLLFNGLHVRRGCLVSNQAHRAPVLDRWSPRSASTTQRVLKAATTLIVVRGLVRSIVFLVILIVIVSIYGFAVDCRTQARLDFDIFVFVKHLCNFCNLAYVRLGEHNTSRLDDPAVVEDDLVRLAAVGVA